MLAFIEANGLTDGTDAPVIPDEPDEPIIPDEPIVSDTILTGGETSRSEDVHGLAFKFDIVADGIAVKNSNFTDYTNATVTIDGVAYKLVEMGAVVTNDVAVGAKAENLTLENLSGRTLQIKADRLFDLYEGGATYAVRIINIPADKEETVLYARGYYVVEMDGELVTVYGDIYADNYVGKIDMNDGVLEW